MSSIANKQETVEYRLALIDSSSGMFMSTTDTGGSRLPSISIPRFTRPAEEINDAIYREWQLKSIVLSFLHATDGKPACAVAEVISPPIRFARRRLTLQSPDSLNDSELTAEERRTLDRMIAGTMPSTGPFARLGWFREAKDWIERSITERAIQFSDDFRQFTVGETFALIRMRTTTSSTYWLKAAGEPNAHECALTVELSKRFPQHLPVLSTVREDWNAWVTEDAGETLCKCQDVAAITLAVESLADLQIKSLGNLPPLIAAGCMNRALSRVQLHLKEMFAYIEEAMRLQTSTKVSPLCSSRLLEIAAIVDQACDEMQNLGIPDCLVNGDINLDNVLFDGFACRFIDWAEGGIGNPFLTLQQVIQHVIRGDEHFDWVPHLCAAYKKKWLAVLEGHRIERAFNLMPLLTMADYLYGRGEWLNSSRRDEPGFQSFARTLARCMNRAANHLQSSEVLHP